MELSAIQKDRLGDAFVEFRTKHNSNLFRQEVASALGVDPYGKVAGAIERLAIHPWRESLDGPAFASAVEKLDVPETVETTNAYIDRHSETNLQKIQS